MAIFHLSAHDRVSRSAGQSSVASAAYMMRAKFTDARTGQGYDFRHRGEQPEWVGMFSPNDAPDWTREAANAERFWNALELFEKRKDAQIALPLDIALPHEMTLQQNIWLAQDYIRENFTRQGYAVLAAMHPPDHDGRNIHLHLLVSLRKIDANGFARTKTEQQENYRNRDAYVENLREKWERLANRHLERHGIEARIDRRSLQEQGIDRAPQKHRGPSKAAAVFVEQDRQARAAAVAEIAGLTAQIIELDAKRAEREAREAAKGRVDEIVPTKDATMDKEPTAPAADAATKPDTSKTPARDAANQNQRGAPEPMSANPTFGPETIAASSLGEADRIAEKMRAAAPHLENVLFEERKTFRPTTNPEPGRYDELKPPPEAPPPLTAPEAVAAAKADNFRVLPPDEARETVEAWVAAQQPGANQNNPERVALAAEQEARPTPEPQPAPTAPEQPKAPTGEPPRGPETEFLDVKAGTTLRADLDTPEGRAEAAAFMEGVAQRKFARTGGSEAEASTATKSIVSRLLDGIGEYLGGIIHYLADWIAPSPPPTREEVAAHMQRAAEDKRQDAAATEEAYYRQYIPGYDRPEADDGWRDWRGRERPEPERDRARERGESYEPE